MALLQSACQYTRDMIGYVTISGFRSFQHKTCRMVWAPMFACKYCGNLIYNNTLYLYLYLKDSRKIPPFWRHCGTYIYLYIYIPLGNTAWIERVIGAVIICDDIVLVWYLNELPLVDCWGWISSAGGTATSSCDILYIVTTRTKCRLTFCNVNVSFCKWGSEVLAQYSETCL